MIAKTGREGTTVSLRAGRSDLSEKAYAEGRSGPLWRIEVSFFGVMVGFLAILTNSNSNTSSLTIT